jgi:CheY-like chemotaxis protein
MDTSSVTRRVLVVDDDLTFVRFVSSAIENLGIATGVALTGVDALQRLAQGGWAGVLLDLKLPDIHGVEVLRRLRERGDFVPVVVLSGAASVRATVEAMTLGAVNVLEKPIRLPALALVIEQLLTSVDTGPKIPADHVGEISPLRHDFWHSTELVARDLVAVVGSTADSPTVPHWAALLGVSSPVVRARCGRARLRARACLNLGRIVRASGVLTQSNVPISEILACRDERTIAALLARGGLAVADLSDLDLRQLLTRQRFVRHEAFNEAFLKNLEQNRLQ